MIRARVFPILMTIPSLLVAACSCSEEGGTASPPGADSGTDGAMDGSTDGPMDSTIFDTSKPDVDSECPGGCDDGEVCSHGQCVPLSPCTDDNDCSNDSYCDPQTGCIPWGTPPGKTHDPECIFVIAPGQFAPTVRCEFSSAPPGDPFPNHLDVQATPVVVNFNQPPVSGPPSIIAPFTATVPGSYTEGLGVLRILRGTDCTVEAVLGGTDLDGDGIVDWVASPATPALGDLDGDGVADIVTYGGDGSLLAFTRKSGVWSLLWKGRDSAGGNVFIDPIYSWTPDRSANWAGPSIHDLDDDGVPEIIREGYVFSAEGILLSGLPPGYAPASSGLNPVLANLDDDPDIEFTNGQFIWAWSNGQWVQEGTFPGASPSAPGYVAVADFGPYGSGSPTTPEIVVVRSSYAMIYATDGTFAMDPIAIPGGGGGNPTVADYDGDGLPELGVAGADYYTVFDIDCTATPRAGGQCASTGQQRCDHVAGSECPAGILWSRKTQDHSSNITGSSVFDFEADGKAEVVYADECFVRVYDGTTGDVLFSQYRSSCTWFENPVVADVDGNFRADLVVPSNLACAQGGAGVACGDLNEDGVDPQFAGLRCKEATDCVSGSCVDGLCRCTSTSQCCSSQDDALCLEMGFACVNPPASIGGEKTCRAAHPHGVTGIRVYSDSQDRWVRSRTVWNQHAYAVTHVHDDGTIPATSAWVKNWEHPDLNNFRQNVPGTPNGQSTADPTAGASQFNACGGGKAMLNVAICNRGADAMGAGVSVGFYDGSELVCETKTSSALQPGECETVTCTWDNPPTSSTSAKDIKVVANYDGALRECKEGNNEGIITGVYCAKPR
ncbi:MAG TPA: CARDB domain-containing protein [Polyangiaceae bacterium]|nr:MAG: hypothetical protein BWY17_03182 [Deltaproteobacteria bacterium ADurb.Bin207]HNS96499.1 CARDB domain-containing protein [Polyangiaceae bacterium]HNZ24060.1 CARDB domain-containing protein [Polyangiaceae bacterium]HOD21851.1 CARDB domain-containing protein [Polyangiaceae bacterium]HOE49917.1 CARDB domain-containing protein [Polyangiaceae bacterium]